MEMAAGLGCSWQRFVQGLPPWLGVALGISAWLLLAVGGAAHAQSSCSNPIVCENSLPGNPEGEWDISGAGSPTIQGFATDISVNQGETVRFKVDTDASAYRLDIYRMGYYGGMGARKVATVRPSVPLPQNQPDCLTDPTTGLIDCGNWAESAAWAVPPDATSGIYLARLVRESGGSGASHIVFIVRDDDGGSDLLFQTSDTTWQAYNNYGGNSLYTGAPGTNPGRAYEVSYNRPFNTRAVDGGQDWLFNAEYPMIRWLEANGYNVSYSTGVDSDRRGQEILEHRVFLSVGHDEYWSAGQRANVEAARNAGVHLAFFSGNEIFWKVRWDTSIDGSGIPYRTLVAYKETHANAKIDPLPNVWTGTWRDPRFSPPADGGRPENALSGTIFAVNCCTYAITVPAADGKMRFWRNTTLATLASGQTATLPDGTLGYEWDEDLDNGFRPAGLIRLSSTTINVPQRLLDYGSAYGTGTATHRLTLYRHGSGALVFGAGTVQWSWGLDGNHDRGNAAPDVRMQQATVNLLADMGVQPFTLQSGLVAATASTDNAPPFSTITAPAAGSTVASGRPVTVTGTAADAGGGVVGGVEVSVDGGTSWHPAAGRETWSFSWTPTGQGSVTITSRAADDSGNIESSPQSVTVSVGGQGPSCPCSIWGDATVPAVSADPDTAAVEVGVKFRAAVNGSITGLRFYKSAANTGPHVGKLWTASGGLLASVSFTNETSSGWQQANFATPVAITANTTYVASYHTTTGHYSADEGYFAGVGVTNGPLQALASGADGPNGVYVYGASAFPTQTFNATNYWVDVVFITTASPDSTPPTVGSTSVPSGSTGVNPDASFTITFSEAMDPATINGNTIQLLDASGNVVSATVTYDAATRTATLNPTATLADSTTYTLVVKGGSGGVKDAAGNALAADSRSSFATGTPPAGGSPDQGPGGPILVVATGANPFSRYYAEILRTEGLNAFTVSDISSTSAQTLADYDVVILGAMPLTAAQVAMFSDWVNAGGKLIAMRPDKQLAGLLGLTSTASVLADAYLLVNTATGPGVGLVNQTIQFRGIADRYSLSGASSLATLYASATTATANPAVTLRSVGPNGGQAAAFTYDLALSVVDMRQGNTAWAGQERDGLAPIRSDDMFFGNASGDPQPDWVDLNKVAIPQADEQQRLLANLILHMSRDKQPLPRFWYFPHGKKAVVVMTGDDHGIGGTAGRFDQYKASSPSGCSVADWECVRGTSYIYPNTPLSNAQAASYVADGFEVGLHITTGCADWTPASLESFYSDQLDTFAATFPGVPAPATNRTHCIVWSDYVTQAHVALAHGIRLDTNYYYWPPSWVADRPGFFTGSGMPMRFADLDGSMIDVYQAATQMTDESGQTFPFTVNALLDKAVGPEGYYGAFTANMHTDFVSSSGSDAIVASAQARGVPVVSARQMLNWLDGRNGSSFGSLAWSGGVLSFTIAVGPGANGLQAMVPTTAATGTLTGITRSGNPVTYTTLVVKGVAYAFFPAVAGAYQATYASDTTPPTVSTTVVPGGPSAADPSGSVTITFSEAMDPSTINSSTIILQDAAGDLVPATVIYDAATRTATLNPTDTLAASATYTLTVKGGSGGVKDAAGNALAADSRSSFTTAAAPSCPCSLWSDTTTPAVTAASDTASVELGVKFRAAVDGSITGVRFYKGAGNTGTHTGHLWGANGALLATATFTNETASGWQQASFATPVAISANTTYVVSYHAPAGRYAADGAYFAAAGVTNGPLRALASGEDGGNGVYIYGASGFPSQSFNHTNYWVDVVFTTGAPANNPVPATSGLVPSTATAGGGAFTLTVNGSNFIATSLVRWNGTDRPTTFVSATQLRAAIPASDIAQAGAASVTVFTPAPGGGTSNAQTFTVAATGTFTDTTAADFGAGTLGTATYVGQSGNGEVLLAPTVGAEFAGSSLPSGWTGTPWGAGGSATVANGRLTVNGARAGTVALFTPGRSLEFVATFSGAANQHVGFGVNFSNAPWAMFSTNTGNGLWARTRVGSTTNNSQIPGNWLGAPHRFRIDWHANSVVYSIDGTVVATHARTITAGMRPLASDTTVGGGTVTVDWLRMTPYAATGTFTSRVFDAGRIVPWGSATWTSTLPTGTSLGLSVRQGNTPTPDGSWTPFMPLAGSGATVGGSARYVQYRATLSTNVPGQTPALQDVTLTHTTGGL